MKKRIIILGGSGFVGRNVGEELSSFKDYEIILHKGKREFDLKDEKQLSDYLSFYKPAYIINCSAKVGSLNYVSRYAADVIDENLKLILSLYNSVVKSWVNSTIIHPIANCAFPASAIVYKEDEWLNGPLHPSVMPYGSTRRMIWHIGESFAAQYKTKSLYFFVPNMYGPYDSTDPDKAHALNALVSKFVKADCENKREIVVWGRGIAVREWLFARDFGRFLKEHVIDKDLFPISDPINIGQNYGFSIKYLVEMLNKCFFNDKFNITWDESMPDGAPRKVMSNINFRSYFPEFKFTDIMEGINETIEYYKSIYPY